MEKRNLIIEAKITIEKQTRNKVNKVMVIDSHQHFWNYKPSKHKWIDDSMSLIRKDFMPSDLKKVYDKNKIDGCIAIQADQTLEETNFLLDLSKENTFSHLNTYLVYSLRSIIKICLLS